MRLSHLVLALASLLPLSTQAITLDKLGGHWVNTDITCKPQLTEGDLCEFFLIPKNKDSGEMVIGYKGKKVGRPLHIGVSDEDVWTVSIDGTALGDLEYEDGMLYDDDNIKYYRVSK